MPLAAVIHPSPAPGTVAVRTGSAGTPDSAGAAAAFDALLGNVVPADERAAGGARMPRGEAAPDGEGSHSQGAPFTAQQDVHFGAGLVTMDRMSEEGLEQVSVPLPEPEQGPAATSEDMAAGAKPDAVQTVTAPGPAPSGTADGEAAQMDARRAAGVRDRGAEDAAQKPVEAAGLTGIPDAQEVETPETKSIPAGQKAEAAETATTPDAELVKAPEATATPDVDTAETPDVTAMPEAQDAAVTDGADLPPAGGEGRAEALAPARDEAVPPAQAVDLPPQTDGNPATGSATAMEPETVPQPASPAQAPAAELVSNAASVRRESEPRRAVQGGDAGKAGDEPAKPAQSGAKVQEPAAAPPAAPAKTGAPDLPQPLRSADAFQALLQSQTRPSAETAAPRAGELSLDPTGDTGLRSSSDRAAEFLRTSGPTPPGATPRFAPQTVQTLAAQIVRRQTEGGRVFDIRLDPPELGRVGVRLEMGKDQMVKAMLSAERPDTLQELQRTARDLERALADAGLNLAENGLSFSLGGERGERDAQGFDAPRSARSVVEIDVARPGAPLTALYGFALARAAGLDIQA